MALQLPYTLSDHPSLIGIIRFPKCNYSATLIKIPVIQRDGDKWQSMTQRVEVAREIINNNNKSFVFEVNKEKITDFYPYTYYVLSDGETEPLILKPQYMKSISTIKSKYALSNQPIERYYVEGYKNDITGNIYNITNFNQMMLPTATNEGISYMNSNATSITQNRKNMYTDNILNAINVVGSAIATSGMSLIGGGVGSVISGISSIQCANARNKDLALTPSSINSFGTPSTRQAFGTNSVNLIKYTVNDKIKNKIENYCKNYGNLYNNYASIDIKEYKGYIKFVDIDIDSGIDNIHLNKIIEILERGIYIE